MCSLRQLDHSVFCLFCFSKNRIYNWLRFENSGRGFQRGREWDSCTKPGRFLFYLHLHQQITEITLAPVVCKWMNLRGPKKKNSLDAINLSLQSSTDSYANSGEEQQSRCDEKQIKPNCGTTRLTHNGAELGSQVGIIVDKGDQPC